MLKNNKSKRSDKELLEFLIGTLPESERKKILNHVMKSYSISNKISRIIKMINRPTIPSEQEKIDSSTFISPEQQAEEIVNLVHQLNRANRISIREQIIALTNGLMNTIKQLVPQTHKPVIAGAVLTTCFLLFFVCNTVYKKYQSHHFSMVGQKEISHNYAVPKFLVLRPAGQDLKPALFAAQMGKEGIFNPEKLFVNSLKYDSRNVTALKSLGMIHLFKREYDKAEGYYVRALELTDDKADILNDLAVLQFEYSNEREAYALLKNATKRVPDKIEVIYNLALVCRVLNKPGEAKFWEKKFKSLNNSDEWEQMFKEKLKNLTHHKVEHN